MNKTFVDFFGFTEDPFKRTPDIDFYFTSVHHQEALNTLNYFMSSDEGFVVLVGEPGTGKSITVRRFIQDLPSNVVFAYILFPNLKPEELFKAILEDFGINPNEDISKNALFSKFRDFLLSAKENGKEVLIIIDEAQNIPVETLEELRILSNLETEKEKLLKIAMVGQPELMNKINSDQLCQLKQRIALYAWLKNFTAAECINYINFRLSKAGSGIVKVSSGVGKRIWSITNGNPRLINTLMSRAIITAYLDGTHTIKPTHISRALKSINHVDEMKTKEVNSRWGYAAVAGIILLCAVVFGVYGTFFHKTEPVMQVAVVTQPAKTAKPVQRPADPTPSKPAVIANDPVPAPAATLPPEPAADAGDTHSQPSPEVSPAAVDDSDTSLEVSEGDDGVIYGVGSIVTVTAKTLNVRSHPHLNSERVGRLYEGQRFIIKDETQYWIGIEMQDGSTGWVNKTYLKAE